MNKPNTFIIGFSKCGTTALANYLNQHNDCFVPKIKEPRYMVKESILKVSKRDPIYKGLINTSVIDSSEYYQLYSTRKEKVLIDASVQYINHLDNFIQSLKNERIKSDEINIIVCLRDPIKRIISNWMYIKSDLLSFGSALKEEDYRKKMNYNSFWFYTEQSKYISKLNKVIHTFPKTHLVKSESLLEYPEETLIKVHDFLEISSQKKVKFKRNINSSQKNQQIPNFGKLNHFINRSILLNYIFRKITSVTSLKIGIDKFSTVTDDDLEMLNKKLKDEILFIEKCFKSKIERPSN